MDINSNRGSHAASKPKHISRLRKEMLQHRMHHNPFSSPPSSTGSHDTVSTTTEELTQNLSNFSFSPDDEGTRRFGDDFHTQNKRRATRSGRFGSKQMPDAVLNTSAIARTFPEWSGLLAKDNAAFIQTLDMAAPIRSASTARAEKENVPPAPESTQEHTLDDASESRRKRPRPDMQARVENESDCSTVLSLSPGRPALAARRSRFATSQPAGPRSPEPPKRSLQDMVSKIRTEKQTTKQDVSPRRSPSREVAQPQRQTPEPGLAVDDTRVSPASRSFFLPAFRHLPDWASGTLRFSTMKNGVPVFVKSGKSGVRLEQSGKNHGDLRAVSIPKEDEQIFVSMDKLQEEVRELHDHDAMLQREAERLQREVNQLQAELKRLKSRKLADSAIGSDSDGSFRRSGGHGQDLESQIAQLRDRLDQASRQVGVNDIHSAALAAERDEALHQASVARERAAKLQAELEAVQKDLESSLQLLHAKETLQLENASLLAENVALSEQRDAAVHSNKTLSAENERLHLELARAQKDLARTREELASVRKQYEAVQEQKRKLAQDHASMERSNENYSKENKRLQAQVAAREKHIADLKKGISSRDKMIDKIQGITTDTAMLEANADLEAEVEHLQKKIEQQSVELHQKDGEISAKEGRIRSLKEKNLDLSIDNERLRAENQRLHAEHEEIRSQWVDERQKAVRLDQLVAKNNLHDTRDDCIFLDDDFNQKEAALRQKLERREAAVKKVKQLSSKISQIAEQEFMGKTAKVARVLDPKDMQTATDESSGKSTALHVDDDPTTEIHLTQGSDFASVMEGELARLKQTYRDLQSRQQQGIDSEAAGNTAQMAEFALPTLHPALHRSKSDSSAMPSKAAQSKNQPSGVLKKSSQFIAEEDTGRFSVESALSIVSHHTDDELLDTFQNRKPSGPARRVSRLRRNSEADREPTETEPNMTSAFFMPDITLEGKNKQSTSEPQQSEQHQPQQQQQPVPSLSKDARRVLDGICKHNSTNCNVCVRIAAHGDKHASTATRVAITAEDVQRGKKTVSADKPVPVSDRGPEPAKQPPAAEEQPTVRPAMAPGEALAVLIKETQDEIDHLQMELRRLNDVYFGLDKALGQRERRRVMGEIKRLQGELEAKSGHLYRLHDVLEGQKLAGQLMAGEAVDVTVLSGLVRAEVLAGQGEREWVGFD